MRKLIFQEFISLDGYAADKNNETRFFEDAVYSESDEDLLTEMERFDTILLGAKTYKMFVDFWPHATNEEQIVADKLNSIPKIVFSKTLDKAPWGKWQPARIIATDAITAISELKAAPGKDMVLWGSISLAQQLMPHKLIDEYHIRIVPVILGDGRLLFTRSLPQELVLHKTKQYASGLLLAEYFPKKE
jgi:dihydrofolate reductase